MNTNSLQQHVNEPTRGNNILDLVMTTTDLSINGLEVTDKIGDHQMIDFSLEKDPGSNPAADMVDAARNTAWDLGNRIIIEVIIRPKNGPEGSFL
ncbi:hypothetical protein FHG87_008121 [Trinorchestia longiramus]|nr:hypothetical protein FHG87_008121 [Trinorchestia longiramus]